MAHDPVAALLQQMVRAGCVAHRVEPRARAVAGLERHRGPATVARRREHQRVGDLVAKRQPHAAVLGQQQRGGLALDVGRHPLARPRPGAAAGVEHVAGEVAMRDVDGAVGRDADIHAQARRRHATVPGQAVVHDVGGADGAVFRDGHRDELERLGVQTQQRAVGPDHQRRALAADRREGLGRPRGCAAGREVDRGAQAVLPAHEDPHRAAAVDREAGDAHAEVGATHGLRGPAAAAGRERQRVDQGHRALDPRHRRLAVDQCQRGRPRFVVERDAFDDPARIEQRALALPEGAGARRTAVAAV
ncbi:MAG: hypothetical protein U0168_26870 [Nannocystaceae bacterium]